MAYVEERDGVWSVRWREGGRGSKLQRITVRTERRAHSLAEEIEDDLERYGRFEPHRARQASALRALIAAFLRDTVQRRRPNTAKRYGQSMELFQRFAGEVLVQEALSYRSLSDFQVWLREPVTGRHLHRRGEETVRKHVVAVEQMWRWGERHQSRGEFMGIPLADTLGIDRQPAPHKLSPTWADMDACIEAASGWQRRLYVMLRSTGLRVAQVMDLRWNDFDFAAKVPLLHVRPELGKSKLERRGRWVPIAPALLEVLDGWTRTSVFVIHCGRITREARARDADRAWKRAGVDKAIWKGCGHHAFRAGFQSELKRAGADDEAVKFLVGHSLGVREHYLDPSSLPMLAAVKLVPCLPTCSRDEIRIQA